MTDIRIVEVAARDGLQSEPTIYSAQQRAQFVDDLVACGIKHIEAGSFVHPKAVPQMANSDQVFALLNRQKGVNYSALVPNTQGFELAQACNPGEVAVFMASSEGFSQNNTRCSIAESVERIKQIITLAQAQQIPVRGYLSTVVECPYDGLTKIADVVRYSEQLIELGCYEVSLGDTIGKATPQQITQLLAALLPSVPASQLALHCHDTYDRAIDNVLAGAELGITTFDSSAGGIGGCPYAPGAAGNVATEAVVEALHSQGLDTGINLQALRQVRINCT